MPQWPEKTMARKNNGQKKQWPEKTMARKNNGRLMIIFFIYKDNVFVFFICISDFSNILKFTIFFSEIVFGAI